MPQTHLQCSFQARLPDLKKNIQLLGNVQRHSRKFVNFVRCFEYGERHQLQNLDGLPCRMEREHDIGLLNSIRRLGGCSVKELLPGGLQF